MSVIVIMPGGFHPFHAGHASLYNSAKKAFPNAEVYVAATNDTSTRPFPFAIKEKLAKVAGVEDGHFVQVKSPFQAKEITSHYDPEQDVLVFVRSEKDKNESPKPGGMKKDGTSAYFQPLEGNKDKLEPFAKHAYFAYLPTIKFGPGISSATEIRNAWPTLDERRKTAMVMSLYPVTQKNPKLAANVVKLLDMGMPNEVEEGIAGFFSAKKPMVASKPLDYAAVRMASQQAGPQKQVFRSPEEFAKSKQPAMAESRIMDRDAKINAYYVSKKGDRHRVAENIPYYLLDKLVPLLTKKYAITMNDIEVRPADKNQYRNTNQPAMAEGEQDVEEGKKKRKKKSSKSMGGYFFPGYAYFGGGDSGEGSGDGGGESINHGMAEGEAEALQYATKAHAGQTRSGGDPYISHPVRVANHIRQYKQSHNLDALISAAYLHDTIEDTDTTQEVLHDLFGGLVASLVQELTSDPAQIKKMGKAQYLAHKMAAMSSYALVIKLADRLDNVKDITTAKTPEWRAKYAKETNHILDYIEKTRALSGTHNKLISLIRAKLAEIDNPQQGVAEAYDHSAPFNAADFNRHMAQLRAREELRKTDPMKALVGDLIDKDNASRVVKKKPEDDSMSINDPRHPSYAYSQGNQHTVDESAGTLGLRTWSGQVKLAHGKDVKFYNRKNDTIDRVVAMNGQKLVGIFDRATDKGRVIDEDISRRGILKGLAGAGALGAVGKASAIAGAFPTPSHQAAMYKAAADSNAAQARADAAAKAKADAERLRTNAELVDKEQRVNHHKLDEFAPDNGDDGDHYAEYVVYQCDPTDQFEFIGGPLYQSDNLGMAHKYAYEHFLRYRPKAFVIYQPHAEASRGNYGVKDDETDITENTDYLDEK